MSPIDVLIIVVYMGGMIYMGYRLGKDNKDQSDYFLAGRRMPWVPVGLSIAATMLSANGFIGGPGWAYNSGMTAFVMQLPTALVLFLVCYLFLPFLYHLKLTSCYAYLEMRLGAVSRTFIAVSAIVSGLILVSAMIYTPSFVIQTFTGWDLRFIIPIVVIVAIVYTLMGGIKAVIWSDAIQVVILWGGLIFAMGAILTTLDMGFLEAVGRARAAGKLDAISFSASLGAESLWIAIVGYGAMWLQYFMADQSQVQRMFSSKSIKSMKQSFVLSGIQMNLLFFLFCFNGILLYVFYGGKSFDSSNSIMTTFMANHLPVGVIGLILAAMFAACMSSIDSLLNSLATVYVKDIHERWFTGKEASLRTSMTITGVFGVIITFFAYIGYSGTSASILQVVGEYSGYINGSILGTFLLAMLTRKANDRGVVTGAVAGMVATALVAKSGTLFGWGYIHWGLYYTVGTVVTLAVGYLASFAFTGKPGAEVAEFTIKGQRDRLIAEGRLTEDGASVVPGRHDKYSWFLLGTFFAVLIILFLLTYL